MGKLSILLIFICTIWYSAGAQSADSTLKRKQRGKAGIFFKKHLSIRNSGSERRYRREEKSTEKLAFPFDSEGYHLVFEDPFDSLNSNIWGIGQPWGRFHAQFPHQYYGDSEVFVKNGMLHLQNRYAPKTFRHADSNLLIPYGTGLVQTFYSKNFTYGYFSIRSKNPSGPATWPAFWLTGRYNWPPEIDIFEMYGKCDGKNVHEQTMTLHYGKIENRTKSLLSKSVQLPSNTDTSFHIYSCLWEPGRIIFFTDGVLLKEIRLNAWMEQFFKEPMYILLNNAVDHRYLQCLKPEMLPCDFEVDWIRVYQKK
ncbi:MAG: glycoside hydrolase family 16 protein [Bacteroidetes bacterium]|nr:glycoside hydrolase family 16 protein [Bacteroidota bacterium]